MSFTNEILLGVSTAADGSGNGSPSSPYVVNTPDSFGTAGGGNDQLSDAKYQENGVEQEGVISRS